MKGEDRIPADTIPVDRKPADRIPAYTTPAVSIIAAGEELVRGQRQEGNGSFLSERLFRLGFRVRRIEVVGDNESTLGESFQRALQCSEVVLVTGGLGPTGDDITRPCIASALKVELQENPGALNRIKEKLALRNRPFDNRQASQAQVPAGGRIVENPVGIAPGFWGRNEEALYLALPGVPEELRAMWEHEVAGILIREFPGIRPAEWKVLRCFGIPEAEVQRRISRLSPGEAGPEVGICARFWEISVYLTGSFAQRVSSFIQVLKPKVFAEGDHTLEEVLVRELQKRGVGLSAAESLTGGGIGKAVTSVAGASEVFAGGYIVYSDAAKVALGVPSGIIGKHGAVSAACAEEMASSARRNTGASLGLGVTGFAGPGGGSKENPVGTVFVGGDFEGKTTVRRIRVTGGREHVRNVTVNYALALGLDCLGYNLL